MGRSTFELGLYVFATLTLGTLITLLYWGRRQQRCADGVQGKVSGDSRGTV